MNWLDFYATCGDFEMYNFYNLVLSKLAAAKASVSHTHFVSFSSIFTTACHSGLFLTKGNLPVMEQTVSIMNYGFNLTSTVDILNCVEDKIITI